MTTSMIRKLQAACLANVIVATLVLSTRVLEASGPPVFASAGPASGCTSASAQCVTAQPQSDLSDGQFVKVTLGGFPPGSGIGFRQCIANPVNVATDCTPVNQQVLGIADSSGGGVTYLPVQSGTSLPTDTSGKTIVCDAASPCVIAAMRVTTDLTTAAFTPLAFALSRTDCPPFPNDGLLSAGAASAYRAVYKWEFSVCGAPSNVGLDFTGTSSQDGVFSFQANQTDFAVTGPYQQPPSAKPGHTFKFAPLTTSAVVVAYRIYDRVSGAQIVDLTLTPDLIAQIFQGKIANFGANQAITALNPSDQFPGRIVPFARAEHSAQTLVLTSWLAATAPATWTVGPQQIFPFPPSGVQGKTGSDAVGLAVADPTTVFQDQGNIGFMDSSTAAFYGLPTVKIKQSDGSVVDATPATITQAIADANVYADGTLAFDYTQVKPTDYPMAMPTYMVVPTTSAGRLGTGCATGTSPDACAGARGAKLAAFLRYAVQGGQGSLPPGYAPLPPNMVSQSMDVSNAIPAPPPAAPSPTPTATATASSSPSPSPSSTTSPTAAPTPTSTSTSTPTLTASPTQSPSSTPSATPRPVLSTALGPPRPVVYPSRVPLPTPRPSPCASAPAATATASPAASSPKPSRAPTTPSPATSRGATPTASPCPPASGSSVTASPRPGATVSASILKFAPFGDSTVLRFVVPSFAVLGALGLVGGMVLEGVVRRRRFLLEASGSGGPLTGDSVS